MMTDQEFQAAVQHLDTLVQEFENLPFPQIREMVFELLQAIDAVHREGLERLIGFLRDQGQAELIDRAARDQVVHTLLVLYDLVPPDELARSGPPTAQHFISLDQVERETKRLSARRPEFTGVAPIEEVPAGTIRTFDVDGVRVLIANVDGEIYAVRNQCPGSMAPLNLGSFSSPIVICPWHSEAYDIRTGERADGPDMPKLDVLPATIPKS